MYNEGVHFTHNQRCSMSFLVQIFLSAVLLLFAVPAFSQVELSRQDVSVKRLYPMRGRSKLTYSTTLPRYVLADLELDPFCYLYQRYSHAITPWYKMSSKNKTSIYNFGGSSIKAQIVSGKVSFNLDISNYIYFAYLINEKWTYYSGSSQTKLSGNLVVDKDSRRYLENCSLGFSSCWEDPDSYGGGCAPLWEKGNSFSGKGKDIIDGIKLSYSVKINKKTGKTKFTLSSIDALTREFDESY